MREGEFIKIKTFFEEEIHKEEFALYMRILLHELALQRMGASSSTSQKLLTAYAWLHEFAELLDPHLTKEV